MKYRKQFSVALHPYKYLMNAKSRINSLEIALRFFLLLLIIHFHLWVEKN
jgi:hypothetical protein